MAQISLELQASRIQDILHESGMSNGSKSARSPLEMEGEQFAEALRLLARGRTVLRVGYDILSAPATDSGLKGGCTMKELGMEQYLNAQADQIDRTLEEYNVLGRVTGGAILPQVILFLLQLGPGQRLADVQRVSEELAIRLDVAHVLVTRSNGTVRVEVPRLDRKVLRMDTLLRFMREVPPAQSALLGLSEEGAPLLVYFPSPTVAHLLIAGITGSGKTELLRSLIVSLSLWAGREAAVYIIDPKNARLAELAGLPAVMQVWTAESSPVLLERLLDEMEHRGNGRGRGREVYVVIDELADLVMVDRSIEVALTRLVQRGRGVGMHLIAATQRPSASAIAGLMKANFPLRVSGSVNSRAEAAIATGVAGSGAELLLGKGDMILVHQGRVERFQACLVRDVEALPMLEILEPPVGKVLPVVDKVVDITARLRERLNVRGPGRPGLGYTEEMVEFALGQILATGDCTQAALRAWHKERHGSDINPPRAVAAIEEAKSRALRFGGEGQNSDRMKFRME